MIKKITRKVFRSLGYEIKKLSEDREPFEYPFISVLDLILKDYQQKTSGIFFLQIGAHDGSSADPIHRLIKSNHWPGLLVEPQPNVFNRLKAAYEGEDQLLFENALIGRQDGKETFYVIQDENSVLPFWLSQSASLDREQVRGALYYWKNVQKLEAIPDDYESLINELAIPSFTVSTLLTKYNIQKLDLLIIDTMGFDFEILKMFPFDQIKPAIIHFEHSLLSPKDQEACFKYLDQLGYGLTKVSVDTIAYLHAPIRRGHDLIAANS